MTDSRHKTLTYRGVSVRQRSEELLSSFSINRFVPDDEFAADLQLLVSGKMSPEEHRAYLKNKYSTEAA